MGRISNFGIQRNGRSALQVTISVSVIGRLIAPCTAAGDDAGRSVRGAVVAKHSQHIGADVNYIAEMAGRFAQFASSHEGAVDASSAADQARLEEALVSAVSAEDKALIESGVTSSEVSHFEGRDALASMLKLAANIRHAIGAQGSATSCRELSCGENAICQQVMQGVAQCRCIAGYMGDGFVCNPPTSFVEYSLIHPSPGKDELQLADLHVTPLGNSRVAVVYRDISRSNHGYLMVGDAQPLKMSWSAPMLISSQSQVFNPKLVELQGGGGLAIGYRDQDRDGLGILHGVGLSPGEKVEDGKPLKHCVISPPKTFARHQAQSMVLLPLTGSHVVVLFAEHMTGGLASHLLGGAMYGSAVVANVRTDGSLPEMAGKHRFATGPVARLSAAMLSPASFVVAYRRGENDASAPRAEASCTFVQVRDNELVFATQPLSLEPDRTQIWARSVAPISENTFAYTYHSGDEQVTKQAVLRVDPETHQVSLLREPQVIGRGFTPYVGSLSSAGAGDCKQASSLLFTYFTGDSSGNARAQYCRFGSEGESVGCKDMPWSSRELLSVSGARMDDGRAVLVYTDVRGSPYYQLLGLAEPA